MRKRMEIVGLGVVLLAVGIMSASAWASGTLNINVSKPGVAISPSLYGLMTEEINHSYDGGLYAELIQNRIFQDNAQRPVHWSAIGAGTIALDESDPINQVALTRSLRLDATKASADQRVGVANDGYWGIPVYPNTKYTASFYAKSGGGLAGPLTVDIESNDGATIYATATVPSITSQWERYSVDLSSTVATPSASNHFVISTTSPGTLWLNLVSLMPPTFHDRANGNRIDLMQKLGDMHPAFLRFPGGNYLEGDTIAERFDWKKTIGPLENRPGHRGPWSYRSSDGLGLLEFLDWCEDLNMQPILAVYAGYSLHGEKVTDAAGLAPFVQDALDEIEYVTGDASTTWGKQRAQDGHPEPFQLKYVEVGNEDNLDHSGSYDVRFPPFFDAIKAKYPQLQIIATGPLHSRTPDVYDDHYYRSSRAMERDAHHYDQYDRNGPKIFVGEWATTEGRPTPNLGAALADAAWLTGLERNSDLVVISCYAPLLVNVNNGASQWGTNLIGYNALSSFGSPSYYAQKMFSENRGDHVLPVDVAITPSNTPPPPPSGAVGVGTWSTSAEFKDIQVTGPDGQTLYQTDFSNGDSDWRFGRGFWTLADGALRQSQNRTDCRATVGDVKWTDYTYSLKARKISGTEGFLVVLHYRNANDLVRWNVGGWHNAGTSLERVTDGVADKFGPTAPMTVETGRWYDVRIEVKGADIKCYLDSQLVSEGTEPPAAPLAPIYAEASRDDSTGQVILKIVNVSATPQSIQINLNGIGSVSPQAKAEVLTGEPGDQNSINAPLKVAPQTADITDAAAQFTHEFPAYSVTVARFDVK